MRNRKFWVKNYFNVIKYKGGSCGVGCWGKLIPTTITITSPVLIFRGIASSTCARNCRTSGRELPSSDSCNECLASFQPLLCCQQGGTYLQAGAAPAPKCCPAAGGWTSTWVKGFSWVCGSGIQKLLFSVNGIKLLLKAYCFRHTWKQISSEATKQLSLPLKA